MELKPVDIIFPTFNRRHFIEIVLPQLKRITHHPHRIIIVLNCVNAREQRKRPDDGTEKYLLEHKDLYDILVPLEGRLRLSLTLNEGLKYVTSEDVIVTNDDILLYNYGWLADLYRAYKEGDWFAVVPFMIPYRCRGKKIVNYAPEDLVISTGYGLNSLYRIQNTKKVRDRGGFQGIADPKQPWRDREGVGFRSNIAAKYRHKDSTRGKTGRYLNVRMIDMDHPGLRRKPWEIRLERFKHFIETGELIQHGDIGSNENLVVYPRRH